jgi:hypothetical protein
VHARRHDAPSLDHPFLMRSTTAANLSRRSAESRHPVPRRLTRTSLLHAAGLHEYSPVIKRHFHFLLKAPLTKHGNGRIWPNIREGPDTARDRFGCKATALRTSSRTRPLFRTLTATGVSQCVTCPSSLGAPYWVWVCQMRYRPHS